MSLFFSTKRRSLSARALKILLPVLFVVALMSAQTAQAQGPASWAYPSNVFSRQPPADNGDGQSFLTADGRAKLVVFGAANRENFTPSKYRETILREFGGYDQMDYSPTGKTWFVLSGFRGENIYYQKVMFSCGGSVINVLSVTFPRAEKKFYEGLVEVMEDNFKPATSGQGCG
jgi:hypothetical protein